MESDGISTDGTLILEGLVPLALIPSTSDKSGVSRLSALDWAETRYGKMTGRK